VPNIVYRLVFLMDMECILTVNKDRLVFLMDMEYILCQVKVKFTLQQATKAHRGSRDIALLFLSPQR